MSRELDSADLALIRAANVVIDEIIGASRTVSEREEAANTLRGWANATTQTEDDGG